MFISLKMTGKWSLIGPKTPTSHNTTTQLKTAQKHNQKITSLPIHVCLMPIRVWHDTQSPTRTPTHSGPAHQPTHTRMPPSHTRMIRVSSLPIRVPPEATPRSNFISFIHTRMAPSHTRITHQHAYWHAYAAYQPSLPAISYAYGLVSYAYDQRPKVQVCYGDFPATKFPIFSHHSPNFNSKTLKFFNRNHPH